MKHLKGLKDHMQLFKSANNTILIIIWYQDTCNLIWARLFKTNLKQLWLDGMSSTLVYLHIHKKVVRHIIGFTLQQLSSDHLIVMKHRSNDLSHRALRSVDHETESFIFIFWTKKKKSSRSYFQHECRSIDLLCDKYIECKDEDKLHSIQT